MCSIKSKILDSSGMPLHESARCWCVKGHDNVLSTGLHFKSCVWLLHLDVPATMCHACCHFSFSEVDAFSGLPQMSGVNGM